MSVVVRPEVLTRRGGIGHICVWMLSRSKTDPLHLSVSQRSAEGRPVARIFFGGCVVWRGRPKGYFFFLVVGGGGGGGGGEACVS